MKLINTFVIVFFCSTSCVSQKIIEISHHDYEKYKVAARSYVDSLVQFYVDNSQFNEYKKIKRDLPCSEFEKLTAVVDIKISQLKQRLYLKHLGVVPQKTKIKYIPASQFTYGTDTNTEIVNCCKDGFVVTSYSMYRGRYPKTQPLWKGEYFDGMLYINKNNQLVKWKSPPKKPEPIIIKKAIPHIFFDPPPVFELTMPNGIKIDSDTFIRQYSQSAWRKAINQ